MWSQIQVLVSALVTGDHYQTFPTMPSVSVAVRQKYSLVHSYSYLGSCL